MFALKLTLNKRQFSLLLLRAHAEYCSLFLIFREDIEAFYGVALAGKAVVVLFENVNCVPHLLGCKICILCQREVVGRGGMAQAVFYPVAFAEALVKLFSTGTFRLVRIFFFV